MSVLFLCFVAFYGWKQEATFFYKGARPPLNSLFELALDEYSLPVYS